MFIFRLTVWVASAALMGLSPADAATPRAKRPAKAAPPPAALVLPVLPLTAGQLAAAGRVLTGPIACELEHSVRIEAVAEHPGHFMLTHQKTRYLVLPQETASGAVRLEDARGEIVWLQIPAKSMLLNLKRGQRIADNCLHAQQRSFVADAGSSLGIAEAPAAVPAAPPVQVAAATPVGGDCGWSFAPPWWQREGLNGLFDDAQEVVIDALPWTPQNVCRQFSLWGDWMGEPGAS